MRLPPMRYSCALRAMAPRPRSVIVQYEPPWPYSATFNAQWFSGSAEPSGERLRAQA